MRVLAILALLLASLLLAVPAASAEPVPPQCDDGPIVGPVSLNRNCGLTVEVKAMSCPLTGSWKTYTVENHVVRVYTCDGA